MAGDAGIILGHQIGHDPNQAWSSGADPIALGLIKINGDWVEP